MTLSIFAYTEFYTVPLKDFLRALRENFLPSFPATILLFVNVTLLALLHTALYAETLLMPPALFILLTDRKSVV